MSQHSHTSIFTTNSGVIEGVAKAGTTKPNLTELTFAGLSSVVIYAAAAAAEAGYIVKKSTDNIAKRLTD